jgi:hypothetical protein
LRKKLSRREREADGDNDGELGLEHSILRIATGVRSRDSVAPSQKARA